MNEHNKSKLNQSQTSLSLYAYYQTAGVGGGVDDRTGDMDGNAVYVCKNCGKKLKLSEAASFYGIPACPVCVYAGAPFEIVRDNTQSCPGTDCSPIEIKP